MKLTDKEVIEKITNEGNKLIIITGTTEQKSGSIKKGIIANLLNPSPYIFWFSIGAPTIVKAFKEGFSNAILFLFVFYFVLVGSKIVIAVITGKSKKVSADLILIFLTRKRSMKL